MYACATSKRVCTGTCKMSSWAQWPPTDGVKTSEICGGNLQTSGANATLVHSHHGEEFVKHVIIDVVLTLLVLASTFCSKVVLSRKQPK